MGRIEAALVLLAGGASRRMGSPKALLDAGGTTLAELIVARLGQDFEEVLVSANDPSTVPESLRGRLVPDVHPGLGPLSGIEAGLERARGLAVMAVACDMPYVTPALARLLVEASKGRDAAVPAPAGRPEPACAAYRPSALGAIREALERGNLRAADLLSRIDASVLGDRELSLAGIPAACFRSLNTPADHRAFLDALRHSG